MQQGLFVSSQPAAQAPHATCCAFYPALSVLGMQVGALPSFEGGGGGRKGKVRLWDGCGTAAPVFKGLHCGCEVAAELCRGLCKRRYFQM